MEKRRDRARLSCEVEGDGMSRYAKSWKVFNPNKKQRKTPIQHEENEQIELINWARRPETLQKYPELKFLYANANGGKRHVVVALRLKKMGVLAGVLDLTLTVARGGYFGFYIEMKWGDNNLSEKQKEFRAFLEEQGYCVTTCYSVIEARAYLEWYLDKPRTIVVKEESPTPQETI